MPGLYDGVGEIRFSYLTMGSWIVERSDTTPEVRVIGLQVQCIRQGDPAVALVNAAPCRKRRR